MLKLYKLFMRIADNYAPQFRVTLIHTTVSAIMQALAFITLLPIVALLNKQASFFALLPWLCVLVLLLILQIIFKLHEGQFSYLYWHKLIEEKRLALGNVLYHMPLLKLKKYDSGDLVEIIVTNTVSTASALSQIGTFFVHLLTIPIILILSILLVSWQLGALLLLACAIMYPLFRLTKKQQKRGFELSQEADRESTVRTIEYIQGLTVFKATGHTGKNAGHLQQAFRQQRQVQQHAHDAQKKLLFAGSAVLQITLIILLLLGSVLVHYSLIPISTLAAVIVLTVYLAEPMSTIAIINALFEMAATAQQKVESLLAQHNPIPGSASAPVINTYTINFTNVSFIYHDQQQPVLQNINLHIPAHTITGLVGPSGSGKTTLTQLIAGFIHSNSGTITIGDTDISQLSSKELLHHISVVYQDIWLFNDSIKNNILMGNPHASDEELYQAARSANIHDFIMSLPQQYDTPAGDIGAYLSGGEKQRISIARAILKNAPLVILDEPTSSLDSESEYHVQKALEALVKNKTVIVVAHRLSTIKGADNIVVLDNGHIVQQGNHNALLADPTGLYYRLWQAQYVEHDDPNPPC